VIPLAFACLLLSYVESVSAARALAQANGYEIDPRQELLGLGAANLAAGLFHAYPVAGGLSQSSVNDKAGAKTPLALVFASVTIGLCLMYLTGLLSNLPNVVLAAIVLVAVKGLIDIRELRHVWRVSERGCTGTGLDAVLEQRRRLRGHDGKVPWHGAPGTLSSMNCPCATFRSIDWGSLMK
jgi:MFS superfamily sulfate permease-like transporter